MQGKEMEEHHPLPLLLIEVVCSPREPHLRAVGDCKHGVEASQGAESKPSIRAFDQLVPAAPVQVAGRRVEVTGDGMGIERTLMSNGIMR